jgi:hypothetical protein
MLGTDAEYFKMSGLLLSWPGRNSLTFVTQISASESIMTIAQRSFDRSIPLGTLSFVYHGCKGSSAAISRICTVSPKVIDQPSSHKESCHEHNSQHFQLYNADRESLRMNTHYLTWVVSSAPLVFAQNRNIAVDDESSRPSPPSLPSRVTPT